jgi:transposase
MTDAITTSAATIGCDVGDKRTSLCILWPDGRIERPSAIRTTRDSMRQFFSRPAAHVVLEVGAHSRWVSAILHELGHRVTVANPRRVKLISQNESKTDEVDAELLARLGRADIHLLAPIVHRGPDAQADLAVAKGRDVLVRCRTALINASRGLVKSFGERLPKCESASFSRKAKPSVPRTLWPALKPVFAAIDSLTRAISAEERELKRLAKKYPDVQVISQPHGVGLLTALVFLLTIEDKHRFRASRKIGSYFGLRPRRSQSGENDPDLRITKTGNAFVRRLLVQSANHVLGPFGADSDLRRWGLKLAEGGKRAKKRARVAVARKLAVLMHRLWVTGEVYEPIGHNSRHAVTA